jgi:hypothetical protein
MCDCTCDPKGADVRLTLDAAAIWQALLTLKAERGGGSLGL